MIWLVVACACTIALPFVIEVTRKRMSPEARQSAPGEFADLPNGITHFHWSGPAGGPIAVCIHGLTTPSFVWRSTAAHLARQGFRVLTYDHYGRGYSDRPVGVQDQSFFINHLNDLLRDQNVEETVTVIGFSMGGAVAAAFAAAYPGAVRDVILLAPAGIKAVGNGLFRTMIRRPLIGLWLMLAFYPYILKKGIKAEENLPTTVEGIYDMQRAELNWRGFLYAVHASLKGLLAQDLKAEHRTLHKAKIPVLVFWARDDDLIPVESSDLLLEWNRDVETHILDDAGHGITYTHTDGIVPVMVQFIQRHL